MDSQTKREDQVKFVILVVSILLILLIAFVD